MLLKFDQSPKLLSFTSDHYMTVCTAVIAYITITNTTVCTVVVVQRLPVPQHLVASCFKSLLVLSIVAPKFEAWWPQWRWNNYIIQLSRLILKGLLSSPFLSIIIPLTHWFCTAVIVVIPHTCTHSLVCTVEINMPCDLNIFMHNKKIFTSLTVSFLPDNIPCEPAWDPQDDHDSSPDDTTSPLTTCWAYAAHP
jgi:hypothetical protein